MRVRKFQDRILKDLGCQPEMSDFILKALGLQRKILNKGVIADLQVSMCTILAMQRAQGWKREQLKGCWSKQGTNGEKLN